MGAVGAFSLDQVRTFHVSRRSSTPTLYVPGCMKLMELAGLACAQALAAVYGREKYPKVLVCCGPGNQV